MNDSKLLCEQHAFAELIQTDFVIGDHVITGGFLLSWILSGVEVLAEIASAEIEVNPRKELGNMCRLVSEMNEILENLASTFNDSMRKNGLMDLGDFVPIGHGQVELQLVGSEV